MTARALAIVLLATFLPLLPVRAQGGGHAGGTWDNVAYDYMYWYSGDGRNRVSHIQAVVLWGFAASSRSYPRDSTLALRRRSMEAQLRVESLGRSYFGGIHSGRHYWGSYSSDSLYILEQSLSLPRGDSALVVLVAHADSIGGPPAIVGVVRVSADLPASFWGTMWESGDTTFVVRGRREDLLTYLRSAPEVRRFLDSHVRSN